MATSLSQQRASNAIQRDPFALLRKEMDDLLSNYWGNGQTGWGANTLSPPLDVVETENAFVVKLDAPGMKANDFNLQVHGNTVTLSGERKEEKETNEKTVYRMERRYGSFSRTLTLPCNVNEAESAAEYTNGVLMLTLPKAEGAKSKQITVKGV